MSADWRKPQQTGFVQLALMSRELKNSVRSIILNPF